MERLVSNGKIYFFPTGNHPAILSNAEKFAGYCSHGVVHPAARRLANKVTFADIVKDFCIYRN